MPIEYTLLYAAIFIGAIIQVGVGIGFSIVVAPLMMILLGTSVAVPLLLLLNTFVSLIATDLSLWQRERATIKRAISTCLLGVALGLAVYPLLPEKLVLALTATLLLLGVLSSLVNLQNVNAQAGLAGSAVASGLATVWAATPGPLLVFGLMVSGFSAQMTRRLIQPIALVAYSTAFLLHTLSYGSQLSQGHDVIGFCLTAVIGSLLGRTLGKHLPPRLITQAIRSISLLACLALFRRAWLVD